MNQLMKCKNYQPDMPSANYSTRMLLRDSGGKNSDKSQLTVNFKLIDHFRLPKHDKAESIMPV